MAPAAVKPEDRVSVADLMQEIEERVRGDRRSRLLARGGPREYEDKDVFATVDAALRRALEGRDPDVLLLPDLVGDDHDWRLQTHLTFASHRGAIGPLIIWVKRRVVLPLVRWLHEYNLENFRRQERVNRLLFTCVEELAIQNAKLTKELQDRRIAGLQEATTRTEGKAPEGIG